MKLRKESVLVAAIALLAPATASADWNTQAASCAIDQDSIANNRFFITAGGITFNTGATGTIIATCAIKNDRGTVHNLEATYTDSDGMTTGATVQVTFRKTNKSTGSITTIGTFLSDLFNDTSLTWRSHSLGGAGENVDDDTYYYYVQINLTKALTTQTASIRGVKIY